MMISVVWRQTKCGANLSGTNEQTKVVFNKFSPKDRKDRNTFGREGPIHKSGACMSSIFN